MSFPFLHISTYLPSMSFSFFLNMREISVGKKSFLPSFITFDIFQMESLYDFFFASFLAKPFHIIDF